MRAALLALSVLTLAGCATSGATMSVNRVQVALLLGDVKAQYVRVSTLLAQACEAKTLDPATCASLDAARKEAARVERSVRRALVAPPSNDLDMEQLMEYLGVVMQLAGKAAL